MSVSGRAVLGGVIVAVVGAVVAAGLVFVGTPEEARLRKIDDRRVRDLSDIATSLDSYWNTNQRLPSTLDDAARGGLASVPRDPVTGEGYTYRIVDDLHYELCATFDRTADEPPSMNRLPFWSHGSGRQCFTIEVRERSPR